MDLNFSDLLAKLGLGSRAREWRVEGDKAMTGISAILNVVGSSAETDGRDGLHAADIPGRS